MRTNDEDIRIYLTGCAMQGLSIGTQHPEKAAQWCVAYADAVIEELKKPKEPDAPLPESGAV